MPRPAFGQPLRSFKAEARQPSRDEIGGIGCESQFPIFAATRVFNFGKPIVIAHDDLPDVSGLLHVTERVDHMRAIENPVR